MTSTIYAQSATATGKQIAYLKALIKRQVIEEIDFDDLTKQRASEILTEAQAFFDRKKEETKDDSSQEEESPDTELNSVRLGLCIKLVYNKHEHNMSHPQGVVSFKSEVRQLYKVLAQLENEMQQGAASPHMNKRSD